MDPPRNGWEVPCTSRGSVSQERWDGHSFKHLGLSLNKEIWGLKIPNIKKESLGLRLQVDTFSSLISLSFCITNRACQ